MEIGYKMAKKKKEESVATNVVKIVIWQRFGSNVPHKRAEYLAKEQKDGYGNPVVVNEERGHNEDFGFSQDDVYQSLSTTYNVEGKDKEEVIKILDKSMDKLKKRITALTDYPELSVFANIHDEKEKLEHLRIFKKYVSLRSPNGSYYKEEDGMRVYDFESLDGFLIPIWQDADNLVNFSDYTYNKKVTMQETAELKTLLDKKKKENIKYASFFMMMIVMGVITAVLVFGAIKTLGYHNDAVQEWEKPAEYCAEQSAKVIGTVLNVINDDVVRSCLLATNKSSVISDLESNIKTLNTD